MIVNPVPQTAPLSIQPVNPIILPVTQPTVPTTQPPVVTTTQPTVTVSQPPVTVHTPQGEPFIPDPYYEDPANHS